eukprot:TRINITY_DN19302_c0_g1_i6.p1 TRINITY_DN19302_c0_g1~~TRINITY_DN19302_c0_g1_i6.p1  ORF type:complete len:102 (+),score=4.67 TRINITY_DN19302_c0_g1_i6:213-518(+)
MHVHGPFLAVFCIGVGNTINWANLPACITAAVHDKAHVGFATQHLFSSAASVASFVLLPALPRMWALSACFLTAVATSVYLAVNRHFFQTLDLDVGPDQRV